jgi:ribosome-associated toxin RatA of RatAB toxin-antitoxin module
MKTIHKSVLILHSAQQMFDLVCAVDRYPEFLPWCSHSQIFKQSPAGLSAEIGLSFAGFKQSFVTENTHTQQPDGTYRMGMHLLRGPFSKLEGEWTFIPIATPSSPSSDIAQTAGVIAPAQACRIKLDLVYAFNSSTLSLLVGGAFDKVATGLVDAFVARADKVYAKA